MDNDQFQKLVASLANLSEAELLQLEKRLWDMTTQRPLPTERKEEEYSAAVKLPTEPSEEKWSLDAIQEMVDHLNPAEIDVLHTSVTFHLPKTRYRNVQQVSVQYWTNGGFTGARHITAFGKSDAVPNAAQLEARAAKLETFKEMIQLKHEAREAKNTGDGQRASELIEKAIALGKQLNMPAYQLERMRQLYT